MYIYRSAFATQRRIKNPKRELIVSSLFRFLKYVFFLDWFFPYCVLLLTLILYCILLLFYVLQLETLLRLYVHMCMCIATCFDLIVCTAAYCYVQQLEMHVRLICAVKFYLLTMAMADVDDSCQFSADSQPKSTGLV